MSRPFAFSVLSLRRTALLKTSARVLVLAPWLTLLSATMSVAQPGAPGLSQPLTVESVAPAAGLSADQLLVFADHLLSTGEYVRAITEYRRFLSYYPDDARGAMAHFSMGLAWYRGEKFVEALHTFREVTERYPGTAYGTQAWLWQGESMIRQGHYAAAGDLYTTVIDRFHGSTLAEHARYQQAWTLLYRRQWHAAEAQFRHIPPQSSLYHNAQSLAASAVAGERLPAKSPALAGLLSALLPGSGQLYNGRLGDALLALFLNGLFIAGTIEALHHGAPTLAGVLGFVEAGWYSGNVYGAVNGAYKYNRHTTETFLRNLDNTLHVPVPAPRQTRLIGMQLSLGF